MQQQRRGAAEEYFCESRLHTQQPQPHRRDGSSIDIAAAAAHGAAVSLVTCASEATAGEAATCPTGDSSSNSSSAITMYSIDSVHVCWDREKYIYTGIPCRDVSFYLDVAVASLCSTAAAASREKEQHRACSAAGEAAARQAEG